MRQPICHLAQLNYKIQQYCQQCIQRNECFVILTFNQYQYISAQFAMQMNRQTLAAIIKRIKYCSSTYSSEFGQKASANKNSKKSLYQILEVPTSASMINIKQNFLRLAKIYHPDVYKGKDKTRYEKIQQAYKILSDRVKRTQYDQQNGFAFDKDRSRDEYSQKMGEGGSSKNFAEQQNFGKPKNTMNYDFQPGKQQKMDLQQQYNKFFSKKPKTQFEQIRMNQQVQIRSMSQSQRIRRHFTEAYENPDALAKSQYQKQFGSILNDQINQKNRMFDQKIQNEKRYEQINKQNYVKKIKRRVLAGFVLLTIISLPLMYSFITKYQLQKHYKKIAEQEWTNVQRELEELSLRQRFKFQS